MVKTILSTLAIVLTFVAFYPYIVGILRNQIKPHVFSWIIWGLTTTIVFFAQLEAGGGVGAWPIGLSGLVTIYIAVLAYLKQADRTITFMDWLFFCLALAALPLWYLTSSPLWAVIVLTSVDVLGFGPTFRKAYVLPFEESLTFFGLFCARNLIAIAALETYSWATILFPAAITAGCVVLIVMVVYRRKLFIRQGRMSVY